MERRKTSHTLSYVIAFAMFLCVSIFYGVIASADDGGTQKELEQIAQSALNAEVQSYLTDQPVEAAAINPQLPYAKGIEDVVAQIRQTVAFDEKGNIRYISATTSLEQTSMSVVGDRVVLEGIEHTLLELSVDGDDVVDLQEEYDAKHRFSFMQKDGQWILVNDEVEWFPPELLEDTTDDSEISEPLGRGISGDEILNMLSSGEGFTDDLGVSEGEVSPEGSMPEDWKFNVPDGLNEDINDESIDPAGENISPDWWRRFSKWRVVSYAYQFVFRRNPHYRYFYGHDCTNFASQALGFGGWLRTRHWKPYNWQWVNANNLYWYALYSRRAYRDWNFWHLRPGDIMMVDFNRDGRLDHTVIVTYRNRYGRLFLTYHSNDTKNISMSYFIQKARRQFGRTPAFYPLKTRTVYYYSRWR